MRHYNYTAVVVVVLVLALAGSALANGAVPGVQSRPATTPAPTVEPTPIPAPVSPTGPGAGPATSTTTTTTTAQKCYTANDLVTLTVAQAWELSGRNYDTMREFTRLMIGLSAEKRGYNIPDTREAGMEIGRLIRQKAEADPNQLLYVVVDSSVREYMTRSR